MPEPLSPEYKLKMIENLENAGITDVDFQGIVSNMESMMTGYSPIESDDTIEDFDFSILKGMTPTDIQSFVFENIDVLRDTYNISQENIEKFLSGINKANIMPYKVHKTATKEGKGLEWGFYKNIDRYEKAYNANKDPVYLRFYKDGTHDVLDKQTFDKEKYFNYLPQDIKEKPMIRIDETSMTEEQKNNMYNRILKHQRGL